ncbi:MAG TPA: oligoendopeptidase F [Chloroflexota bacterium]|nr:oligoendopeptidase F [Chloroflexota bacterium]
MTETAVRPRTPAAPRKRSEIEQRYTWDTASVFPDDQAWEAEFARVEAALPGLAELAGTLGQSGEALLRVLETRDAIGEPLERVHVYASMVHDVDTTDPRGQALTGRVDGLWARFGAASAFIAPEMLQVPAETLQRWRDTVPGLAPYRRQIDETLRLRDHVRSSEVEAVLAELTEVRGAASEIAGLLRNADLRFTTIVDEDGKRIRLSEGLYRKLLESHNRRVRKSAFRGIMGAYGRYKNTLGSSLSRSIKGDVAEARIRRYSSALGASLTPRDIPVEVYHNLIQTTRANLPALHRYLRLHQKALGLRRLHLYDLFVSIVPQDRSEHYTYEQGVDLIVDSMRPLGGEYLEVARRGLTRERWVDVFESEGKRSGAYSDGAYKTHPFILMNYQSTLDDVFTLTHELGHSMHSWFTRKNQPYPTGDYTIFVAEVASTFNEELLRADLLGKARDNPKRQAQLLGSALDDFRGTFFRQALFAELELELHQRAERGEALTAEAMTELYRKLVEEYYGAAVVVDKDVWVEWARIPHFYHAFYVYQYATGLAAALALAQKVLQEGGSAVERYVGFLKGGSSADPLSLLRGAGVDMATPEPIERALAIFTERTDRLEQALSRL